MITEIKRSQTFTTQCPHGCVNRLLVKVDLDAYGNVVSIQFNGHVSTHDEWTGKPK